MKLTSPSPVSDSERRERLCVSAMCRLDSCGGRACVCVGVCACVGVCVRVLTWLSSKDTYVRLQNSLISSVTLHTSNLCVDLLSVCFLSSVLLCLCPSLLRANWLQQRPILSLLKAKFRVHSKSCIAQLHGRMTTCRKMTQTTLANCSNSF